MISARQLRQLGLTPSTRDWQIANGRLHPIYRSAYAVGHRAITKHGRYLAAVMACGRGSALSHRSAADLWELRRCDTRIEVTVPRSRQGVSGVQVHRSRVLEPTDVTRVSAIPVTTVERTLLDLAAVLSRADLESALDRAERRELFDLRKIERQLERSGGKKGAVTLRKAVAAWRPRHTRSELEDRFQALLARGNLPRSTVNVLVQGEHGTYEVDCLWVQQRLIVQLDGFTFHRTRRDRERDAFIDGDLELAGYRVVRLTWGDVVEQPQRTVRRISRLLAGHIASAP